MSLKSVIQGLAAVWLVLFVASFVVLRVSESDGSTTSRLALVAEFLTLAVSVFLVGSFVVLIGFRFYVAPLFE